MPMLQRFKGAALGLGITLVPIAALACVQLLLAPYTVATVGRIDPMIDAWAVPSLRRALAEGYAIIALIIAAYWVLAAMLGGGQFLRIKSANIILFLSGLIFALGMAVMSAVPVPARHGLVKGACPVLGLSDEPVGVDGVTTFCFDCLTPCEAFAGAALAIVFLVVPLILLVMSVILRIFVSRRRGGDGVAPAVHP